jgi:hypothetical protein
LYAGLTDNIGSNLIQPCGGFISTAQCGGMYGSADNVSNRACQLMTALCLSLNREGKSVVALLDFARSGS